MYSNAIVRLPGNTFAQGITSSTLGKPDEARTLNQHSEYQKALVKCGLIVEVLEPVIEFPDSTFVEDTAILTSSCAILTSPGAASRRGEVELIRPFLEAAYEFVEQIYPPGTLDGGDICQVENHFLIGISERTNLEGGQQLAKILNRYGYQVTFIDCRSIPNLLHLKSGLSYLGASTLAVIPQLVNHPDLENYQKIVVDPPESYAANCVRINDFILTAYGFPRFIELLTRQGFNPIPLEMSEFQKMDGGLSCLSLRY